MSGDILPKLIKPVLKIILKREKPILKNSKRYYKKIFCPEHKKDQIIK